jgi:hypothetical protein
MKQATHIGQSFGDTCGSSYEQIHCTKFLPPPLKATNGLLDVANIALLAIV